MVRFCVAISVMPPGWHGWPYIPELEKLVSDWVRTTDEPKRKQLADEIQRIALSEVAYVPWGQFSYPTALRKTSVFWNLSIT
jgi:peptide/nickel transport system substrate-binding protein